jgi:cobalt-zinc-cadmium efflux system outer membrane protein
VRRLEGIDENALVGSLQIPLFSGRRNRGELAAFRSERAEIEVRREQSLNMLYARLYDAYATRAQSIAAVQTLADETIPALTSALKETQSAYDAGLYSYLELIAAQRALIDAKQTHIATAANALQAAVVIEQLTGIPLQPGTDAGHTLQETLR